MREPGQVTRGNASSTQVGYAKPPPEYRFKTGVSGNPNGRPRKLRPTPITPSNSVQHVAMAEARREITIRENDGENRVTALEAIMRSMVVGGVKGNRHMQAALVNLLSLAERGDLEQKQAFFETAVAYKQHFSELFRKCDQDGKPRPEPTPHPDDLVANARNGDVIINGPFDEIDQATWAKYRQTKQDALDEVAILQRAQSRDDKHREQFGELITHAQRLIDLIDRVFPDEALRRNPAFNLLKWRQQQSEAFEAKEHGTRRALERVRITLGHSLSW
jgi:hypothetical protein